MIYLGHDESSFYIKQNGNEIKAFDLRMNESYNSIIPTFQTITPSDLFYVELENNFSWDFEKRNNKYYILTKNYLFIFDFNGEKIRTVETNGIFKVDSSETLVILENDILKYFNLDGDPIKKVKIISENCLGYKDINFCIDTNDNIHYLEASCIYFD